MELHLNKTITNQYFFYSLANIVPALLSFLFIPFVIRSFGPEVYAGYSLILSLLSIICMFCYGWVGQSFIRFHSLHQYDINKLTSHLLRNSLMGGVLVFGIAVLFVTNAIASDLIILIPTFLACGYYSFYLFTYQAKQKAKYVATSETARTTINILLPVTLFYFLKSAYASQMLLTSLLLSYTIPLIFLIGKNQQRSEARGAPASESTAELKKQVRSYGLPVAVFFSLSMALTMNDRFIINWFMGAADAGRYGAVYDVLNKGAIFMCSPVLMAYYPQIVREYNNNQTELAYKTLKRAMFLELSFFLAGLFVLYFFSAELLSIFFKDQVSSTQLHLVMVLYVGVFAWQFAMLMHKPLELRKQTKHLAIGVTLAFILNFVINVFLISSYKNVMIAAYTTLGASVFYFLYVAFFSIRPK